MCKHIKNLYHKAFQKHIHPNMSTYTSEYPPVDFDPAYKKFFEDFYATSDTPDAHDKYIKHFTKDATLIMASKKAVGSDRTRPPKLSPHLHPPYHSLLPYPTN